jgi:hypothetical protein
MDVVISHSLPTASQLPDSGCQSVDAGWVRQSALTLPSIQHFLYATAFRFTSGKAPPTELGDKILPFNSGIFDKKKRSRDGLVPALSSVVKLLTHFAAVYLFFFVRRWHLPLVDLFFGFFFGDAVSFLNPAEQAITIPGNDGEIVICQFSPPLLHCSFHLIPLTRCLVPVH